MTHLDIFRSSDGDPGFSHRISIRLSGGGSLLEYVTDDVSFVRKLAVHGTQLTETEICRSSGADQIQPEGLNDYTATDANFMRSNPLYVHRYARRQ